MREPKDIIINGKSLSEILEDHKHWLHEDRDGWESMHADLRYANLREADLGYADLWEADLEHADLRYANLREADLGYADLQEADLGYADLRYANLEEANLRYADLRSANLQCTDFQCADLQEAKNIPYIPYACPDSGSFIGWKKAAKKGIGIIVKLGIPEDARRLSAAGRKCRCDKAKVLSITSLDGKTDYTEAVSQCDQEFIYKVGETVSVPDFDENRWNECSTGIHFFINREEAVRY